MSVYFFDTDDGIDLLHDDVGLQLSDVEAAKREASFALLDMAVDALPSTTPGSNFLLPCVMVEEHLSSEPAW